MSAETREYVEQGSDIIKNNLEKMNEIKQKNADTIAGIKSLNEKINNIWEIVNIINDIADQTKIIAFNAELEASSAGEAGKNFEIVASEIRRLVDNTMSSTREIKSNISEIQKASDDLIVASERATEKIKQGGELSINAGKVFDEILSSAEKSTNSIEQIVLSIEQQTSAFSQILIAMKQISEGIDSFTVSTKSTSGASESLKQTSESLSQIVEKYKVDEKI
jgi:methyl-accepting chemotaxis protein